MVAPAPHTNNNDDDDHGHDDPLKVKYHFKNDSDLQH